MATEIGFSSGKKDSNPKTLQRWWNAPGESVAAALSAYCAALELAQRPRRFRQYGYHMIATGRAPISYGLAMPDTIASANGYSYAGDYTDPRFTPPSVNTCALAIDIFKNRIWAERPFLEWLPVADDDYKIRKACKEATASTDAIFNEENFWHTASAAGKASGIVGTGWVRTADGANGSLDISQIDDDCVLLDPSAGENPRAFQLRNFVDRFALIAQFASDDKALAAKLEKTPGCRLGFFTLPIEYTDTISVVEGWYCSRVGSGGRHVIAVADILLLDEEYKEENPPVESLKFEHIAGSARGRGAVEIQLPIQREMDRIADNLAEQERVMAWGRAQSKVGNGVEAEDLVGNAMITYQIEPVKFEPGIAPPAQLYNRLKELKADSLLSVGLTEQQAQGSATPGVTAAVAMQSEMQISDVRHKQLALDFENFIERIGKRTIDVSVKVKPDVKYQGKRVDFATIEKVLKNGRLRAYPVSGLPQSIPARKQEISDRLAKGQINKAQYQRLLNLPYTEGDSDEETASIDLVYWQLDKMIETGEFQPPLPFTDLTEAKRIAVARYQRETIKGLAKDRLQRIAQYIFLVQERLEENPQAPQPGPAMPPAAPPSPGAAVQ